MRAGAPIIAQGEPSDLGAWSYEVVDTKLARETKGNTVLQIYLYSDLLAHDAQKLTPEFTYVVTPGSEFKVVKKFRSNKS
jgi:predicted RecB family nuclease